MERLSEIAESGRGKNSQQRSDAEQSLLATMTREQRPLWLNLEEAIYAEQNNVQTAMIEAFICPTCTAKECQN